MMVWRGGGIRNYTFEQLYDDYRLCAGINLNVEWCRGGVNESWEHVWIPMVRKAMTAFDDLGCSELL